MHPGGALYIMIRRHHDSTSCHIALFSDNMPGGTSLVVGGLNSTTVLLTFWTPFLAPLVNLPLQAHFPQFGHYGTSVSQIVAVLDGHVDALFNVF